MKISITNLSKIHENNPDAKDRYQIFQSNEGRVIQSMVLNKQELDDLWKEVGRVLNEE